MGAKNTVGAAIAAAMQHPEVLRQLRERAERMLPRAERIAHQAGASAFAETLHVETGVRPGAKAKDGLERPYARVVGHTNEEISAADAAARLTRRQILRRAARG